MLKSFSFKNVLCAAAVLAAFGAFQSCDSDSTIGSSIVADGIQITVDSTFTLSGHSADNHAVRSRTITQLVGNIDAEGYGTLSSSIVTQFMPALGLDTAGITSANIDSLKLQMLYQFDGFTGDSIAPMGIRVYPLTRDLPSPIYSDFDPTGYYDPDDCIGQTVYSASWDNTTSSEVQYKTRQINVDLPVSLGKKLFDAYNENPASFSSPEQFSRNVFKGLYIDSYYGSGRIVRIDKTLMNLYFHRTSKIEGTDRDTTINYVGSYFAVTPEIITNNNIRLNLDPKVKNMVELGKTVIAAPAGLDAEIVFPAREIKAAYLAGLGKNLGVVNTLTMSLSAAAIENEYGFEPPEYLLMVLKKDRDNFFAENKINDNLTSFYAQYSSTTGTYTFGALRDYIINLIEKDDITDEDITFVLTPVNLQIETSGDYYYGTSSTVTAITPYISTPRMCTLDYSKTKIRLTYSKQTLTPTR
ncbi:MAG: DUF4270 family protein [Muribaculaceae bacterium]